LYVYMRLRLDLTVAMGNKDLTIKPCQQSGWLKRDAPSIT